MKVLVLGASGIIGQHLRLCVPDSVRATFQRHKADRLHVGCALEWMEGAEELLETIKPSVIINLAGESRPDVVERELAHFEFINSSLPEHLAGWCESNGRRLIQVSTQAVFGGDQPPYHPTAPTNPVNAYGKQKQQAEQAVLGFDGSIVVRPTFVLGVRPLPHVGRPNPVEQMLEGQPSQVCDRYFSTCFARDAARMLWAIAQYGSSERIIHLGNPIRRTRYAIARELGADPAPVSHTDFPGLAPRAIDTSYADGSTRWRTIPEDGFRELKRDWRGRKNMDIYDRAREIALFLGLREDQAIDRLIKGFGYQHQVVAADWRRANPQATQDMLDWYRTTEEYIWELSAYHCDPGFNYMGMCGGIAERLIAAGANRVLCLGDGIGDLTLALHRAGFEAVYHDLSGSRTAEFAKFRFWRHTGVEMSCELTSGWNPTFTGKYDAIVSLDFLEHVPNVPDWTSAIKEALTPGGFFFAQNAFGIGSGEHGSIPCHLAANDKFEKDWVPLLSGLGFTQESSNWYRRAA